MKFKQDKPKKMITAEDYVGKKCLLPAYERIRGWRERNPERWSLIQKRYRDKKKLAEGYLAEELNMGVIDEPNRNN